MACRRSISSAANNLEITTICSGMYRGFASMYYSDKGHSFRYIFGEYIKLYLRKIYYLVFIEKWKLNQDTSAYRKLNVKKSVKGEKMIITIAKNSGQKLLLKSIHGFIFKVLLYIQKEY